MEPKTDEGQAINPIEGGNPTVTPTVKVEDTQILEKPFREFKTQKDFDDEAARIRGSAERKAEKDLLELLGLKVEEKDKLSNFKKAYDDSLTNEEKTSRDMEKLKLDNAKLLNQLEEKDYTISALAATTGTDLDKVKKIVKMAKGLKDDETTIDDAIQTVISMMKLEDNGEGIVPQKPLMPKGIEIIQPEVNSPGIINPFKPGIHYNETEQGRLYREDPEKAKKLAAEAGMKFL